MSDPLTDYFAGEKQAAVLCLVLGALALAFSGWLWREHGPFRAMAAPLVLVGLVQLGIGVGLLARTDKQVAALRAALQREPAAARAAELGRMDRVNANFRMVEIVEAVLIVAALVMVFAFRGRPAVLAVGLGLLVQAAVMLAFDAFAELRAHAYTDWLRGRTQPPLG